MGAIQVLRNPDGCGGINFSWEKRYEGVRFNALSLRGGVWGVQFPGKKHYVALEWPHTAYVEDFCLRTRSSRN